MATAPWFFEQFRDTNGAMLAGGKMYFFVAGSTVLPKAVYADYGLTTPLTQPLVLDGSGNAPEYFMEPGLYKILVRASDDRLIATRDNVEGVGGGGSPGTDSYQFKTSAADAAPGYGDTKLGPSTTIVWTQVDIGGGVMQMRPSVVLDQVLDWKVKGDASDTVPGYIDAKIENGDYITLTVNPATHRLRADFTGPAYVPQLGGNYTGPVTFEDTVVLGNVPGTGPLLGIDIAGNLTRVALPPIPAADDHLVLASATDTIPGALLYKLMAGSGLRIDTAVDPTYGEILSISMINVPVPVVVPNTRVVVGNGTGVTSFANFTYTNQDLVVGYCEIESFFVSMDGPYAAFHNTGVDARNFRDGYSQHANGDVRLGAAGAYGAIKITDASKIIDTAIDTTLRVGGKMLPPGVEITTNTYQLPDLSAGEIKVIRFAGAAATTVTASATQIPRYRSSTSGLSITGSAGGQIDAAGAFGIVGSAKVAAITLIGIDSTHVQVLY